MPEQPGWRQTVAHTLLCFQPLFAIPAFFTVLSGQPPLWASILIAAFPLTGRYALTRRIGGRTPFDLPVLIFVLGLGMGVVVAPDRNVSLGGLVSTLVWVYAYYGFAGNFRGSNRYWLLVGGTLTFATIGLAAWYFSQGEARRLFFNEWAFSLFQWLPKSSGPALQQHGIAAVLSAVAPVLFGTALFPGHKAVRTTAGVLTAIFLGLLFLSASGTGWLAIICGLLVVVAIWRWRAITIALPAVGAIAGAMYYSYVRLRPPWLLEIFSTRTLSHRVELWTTTLPMFTGYHILTGLGLGSWYAIYNTEWAQHLHNSYLQLYTDTGILGVASFVMAAVVFVRMSAKAVAGPRQSPWYGACVGLIGAFGAGAVFALLDNTITAIVTSETGYLYLGLPLLWIWAALFAVACGKVEQVRSPVSES